MGHLITLHFKHCVLVLVLSIWGTVAHSHPPVIPLPAPIPVTVMYGANNTQDHGTITLSGGHR